MNGKLPKKDWPEELKHPEVKGVFVGGCVERGVGSRFRAKAHAHTHGAFRGWICYLSAKRLTEKLLNLHELAHIVTRQGHTKRWREYLLQIGGTLDPVEGISRSYHPKPRKQDGEVVEEEESDVGDVAAHSESDDGSGEEIFPQQVLRK